MNTKTKNYQAPTIYASVGNNNENLHLHLTSHTEDIERMKAEIKYLKTMLCWAKGQLKTKDELIKILTKL